jgi:hypothetical protein
MIIGFFWNWLSNSAVLYQTAAVTNAVAIAGTGAIAYAVSVAIAATILITGTVLQTAAILQTLFLSDPTAVTMSSAYAAMTSRHCGSGGSQHQD